MMDYSLLSKAFAKLWDRTWRAMNKVLSRYATEQNKISGEKLRLDTTVYETNIHWTGFFVFAPASTSPVRAALPSVFEMRWR